MWLQVWDKRKTESPTHRLTAHSGPVYNCEWHLERDNCFATGGRDKNLKVRSHDSHVTQYCICLCSHLHPQSVPCICTYVRMYVYYTVVHVIVVFVIVFVIVVFVMVVFVIVVFVIVV